MSRKREKRSYTYECTITGKQFETTKEAPNPSELVSVDAYYDLHSDQDDRPEYIILQKKQAKEAEAALLAAMSASKPADERTSSSGSSTDKNENSGSSSKSGSGPKGRDQVRR